MDYLQNVMGYFDQQQPLCAQHDKISKDLYQEYGVKAGLRDENGKGVLAGLFVILLCVLFVAFFDTLGYVVVGALLCGIIMWLIGKRNIVELLLVSILVPLGMWLIFYKMLSVNIPMGVLQPLRDLVDMIHF